MCSSVNWCSLNAFLFFCARNLDFPCCKAASFQKKKQRTFSSHCESYSENKAAAPLWFRAFQIDRARCTLYRRLYVFFQPNLNIHMFFHLHWFWNGVSAATALPLQNYYYQQAIAEQAAAREEAVEISSKLLSQCSSRVYKLLAEPTLVGFKNRLVMVWKTCIFSLVVLMLVDVLSLVISPPTGSMPPFPSTNHPKNSPSKLCSTAPRGSTSFRL